MLISYRRVAAEALSKKLDAQVELSEVKQEERQQKQTSSAPDVKERNLQEGANSNDVVDKPKSQTSSELSGKISRTLDAKPEAQFNFVI